MFPSPTNLQGRLNLMINKLFPNQDVNNILTNTAREYSSLYSCFGKGCPLKRRVRAFATMPKGSMGDIQ